MTVYSLRSSTVTCEMDASMGNSVLYPEIQNASRVPGKACSREKVLQFGGDRGQAGCGPPARVDSGQAEKPLCAVRPSRDPALPIKQNGGIGHQ